MLRKKSKKNCNAIKWKGPSTHIMDLKRILWQKLCTFLLLLLHCCCFHRSLFFGVIYLIRLRSVRLDLRRLEHFIEFCFWSCKMLKSVLFTKFEWLRKRQQWSKRQMKYQIYKFHAKKWVDFILRAWKWNENLLRGTETKIRTSQKVMLLSTWNCNMSWKRTWLELCQNWILIGVMIWLR